MTLFAFVDMRSGGSSKLDADVFYVEAGTEQQARETFESKTGRDPYHVTCPCCGSVFALLEYSEDSWYWPRPGEPGATRL